MSRKSRIRARRISCSEQDRLSFIILYLLQKAIELWCCEPRPIIMDKNAREAATSEDSFWWNARWTPIVGPPPNGSHENKSIDVLCKNCFNNFDTVACVR